MEAVEFDRVERQIGRLESLARLDAWVDLVTVDVGDSSETVEVAFDHEPDHFNEKWVPFVPNRKRKCVFIFICL